MSQQSDQKQSFQQRATKTMPGIVEKIITPIIPNEPEKAQIAVEGADHLYREIRVDNRLKDEDGRDVALKPGAEVDVKIEADPDATKIVNGPSPKTGHKPHQDGKGH
ncbi:MAG: hypothetical protein ACRD40_03755 [Candidatus Acidiferrales bacterium]